MKTTEEKIKETLRKLYKLTKEWYREKEIFVDDVITDYGSATVGEMWNEDGTECEKVCRLTLRLDLENFKHIEGFAK